MLGVERVGQRDAGLLGERGELSFAAVVRDHALGEVLDRIGAPPSLGQLPELDLGQAAFADELREQ